jgi:lysozyme
MMNYDASFAAYQMIMDWEELRLVAYRPIPTDPWTIGWGTTRYPDGSPVQEGDTCTKDQADSWLMYHVAVYCVLPLNDVLTVQINQPMFDALVSWVYNVGEEAMRTSTLMRLLNDHRYIEASEEFDKWVKSKGKTIKGLMNRRNQEEALFNEGIGIALAYAKAQGWVA